jgi:hypothetical protein
LFSLIVFKAGFIHESHDRIDQQESKLLPIMAFLSMPAKEKPWPLPPLREVILSPGGFILQVGGNNRCRRMAKKHQTPEG